MVGPSGSGKSTWIKQFLAKHPDFKVVSMDEMRKRLTGDISNQSKNEEVYSTSINNAKKFLQSGKNVIWDATSVSEKAREKLRNALADVPHEHYYKVMPALEKKVLMSRVRDDIKAGKERSNVPEFAIDKQMAAFKADVNKIKKENLYKE
jgi:predicted kinase